MEKDNINNIKLDNLNLEDNPEVKKSNKDYILLEQFKLKNLTNIKDLDELNSILTKTEKEYYSNYSNSRNDILKELSLKGVDIVDENLLNKNINPLTKNENAFLTFCKAWLFDKLPEYSKAAEDSANKSLKLNPFLSDSYNCIAHIMWKKGDLEQAFNYFKQALTINNKDKNTLRNLSMIIRAKNFNNKSNNNENKNKESENNNININNNISKINDNKSLNSNSTSSNKLTILKKEKEETINSNNGSSLEEKLEKANESLKYAKMAVDLDLKDSDSWYVFGNGYFHYAFIDVKNQYENLNKAVNSYNMSEKYQNSLIKNPDLYYNRANVNLYLENYSKAVDDLKVADSIDTSLRSGELADSVINNLLLLNKQIKSQCNIKPKKLTQLTSSIPTKLNSQNNYNLIEATLDDYNKKINSKNKENNNSVNYLVSSKVIQIADKCTDIPTSLICIDHNSNFFMLTVYNVSSEFKQQINPLNSHITILDPNISKFSFKYNDKLFEHTKIVVTDINKILLNGKYCACYTSISESSSTFFV